MCCDLDIVAIGAVTPADPQTTAKWAAVALTVLLFLLSVRRAGERAGRLAERLETMEKSNDVQRRMLDAAARRPRTCGELARRLRDGRF